MQKSKNKWKATVVQVIFDSEVKMDIAFKDGHKKFDLWDLYLVDKKDKNPKVIFKTEERFREFFEIFVNTPVNICKARDLKGLYKKAKVDKNMNTIGLGTNYEIPKKPELIISTEKEKIESITDKLIKSIFHNF